jgi:hypothetical protein
MERDLYQQMLVALILPDVKRMIQVKKTYSNKMMLYWAKMFVQSKECCHTVASSSLFPDLNVNDIGFFKSQSQGTTSKYIRSPRIQLSLLNWLNMSTRRIQSIRFA